MSGLGVLALVVASAWLAVLSVLNALLVRQVALLTARVDPDYALDGLAIGRRLPRALADLLPDGSGSVLVLGAGCGPCRELALGLPGTVGPHPVLALIEGDETAAVALAEVLPGDFKVLVGEAANRAYVDLELQTTPFLVTAERREIVHKVVPRGPNHFLSMLANVNETRSPALRVEVSNAG